MRAAGDWILGDTGIRGEESGDEIEPLPRICTAGDDHAQGIESSHCGKVRIQLANRTLVRDERQQEETVVGAARPLHGCTERLSG